MALCATIMWWAQVIGSHIRSCKNDRELWEDTYVKLRRAEDLAAPYDEQNALFSLLRISYTGLQNKVQQNMFLDAACFFMGRSAETAKRAWRGCAHLAAWCMQVVKPLL